MNMNEWCEFVLPNDLGGISSFGNICELIANKQTMLSYVVSQLPTEVAAEVIDLIDPMPASNPYTTLEAAIIKRTATSDEANPQKLLAGVELGDRTPSQLPRHMQSIACGKSFDEAILKQLHCQILATQSDVPLSSLAETADKIHECVADRLIAPTSQKPIQRNDNPVMARLDRMQAQIDQLVATVNKVVTTAARTNTSRKSRPVSRKPASPSRNPNRFCHYHTKFKGKALRCTPPCAYVSHDQGNLLASQ
ncbi:hypothetical protein T265_09377 [Opisthorchis viverrini]|uniref:DUF7041 domain-containing protein n=1 Tax=Opisthorchis viverrini TaxID=6198 RepID=A0A074Z610_OPIVI|nr:hypothetical protein T265_09377 [Opisthorchis viverrini]KER22581.1 hypothetical protein T265_09377 [Opisthorchis viverrini]